MCRERDVRRSLINRALQEGAGSGAPDGPDRGEVVVEIAAVAIVEVPLDDQVGTSVARWRCAMTSARGWSTSWTDEDAWVYERARSAASRNKALQHRNAA